MRDTVDEGSVAIPPGAQAPAADPRVLSVRNLSLRRDGRTLLSEIDLDLGPTGVTVVMGPNGAGKSLLLRVLHGLIPASDGLAIWGAMPVSPLTRRRQALVFQKPVLLRRSVAGNVDFALRARGRRDRARRDALLAQVGLLDRAGQPARLLSGGEQQRLALARAFATAPDVLFLDEPTASLDPSSVLRIEEIVLAAAREGIRVIFVTHDIAQARRLADEVVFLNAGRLIEKAPAETFFARPESAAARDYLAGRLVFQS